MQTEVTHIHHDDDIDSQCQSVFLLSSCAEEDSESELVLFGFMDMVDNH